MTLDEIIELRVKLEERIAKCISEFELETQCAVDALDIRHVETTFVSGRNRCDIAGVHATVRLP